MGFITDALPSFGNPERSRAILRVVLQPALSFGFILDDFRINKSTQERTMNCDIISELKEDLEALADEARPATHKVNLPNLQSSDDT